MTWGDPRWLWGLVAVPLVWLAMVAWARVVRARLQAVLSDVLLDRVIPHSVRRRRAARDILVGLGLAGVLVALAEPRFDKVVRNLEVKGSDLVLLLDLSRSMDAQDVDPSRLERARREVADLGAQVGGDRVGLVVFAGGAYPRLPLTSDFRAVELVVSEARTGDFDSQGSDLGAAIRVALEVLRRGKGPAGQAILVLSDGETHDPPDALAAAAEAAEQHVPIFVMGIGERASSIPTEEGPFQYKGEVVQTVPDFDVLKQVAQRTGGAFVTSNPTSKDMEDLYAEIRRSVVAVQRSVQRRETFDSAFQYPLGLAVLLLLAAGWLGDGRRTFGAATAALLVGLASSSAWAADPLVQADTLFRAQQYDQAAEALVELSLQHPDDPDVFERLGAARYRAGDFTGAAQAYERAAALSDDPSQSLFNAGNALYQAGRLEDAQARYEQAVAGSPDFEAAGHNRELVQKEIAARRAQKPPPPPQPQGGGQEPPPAPQPPPPPESESESEPQPAPEGEPPPPPEGTSDPQDGAPEAGQAQDGGPITAAQAERLIDSIEEGSRRTLVRGRPQGKPW